MFVYITWHACFYMLLLFIAIFANNNLRRTCYENPRELQSSDWGRPEKMWLQARTRSLPCHPEWQPYSSGLVESCSYWAWSFSWPERNSAGAGCCLQQQLCCWMNTNIIGNTVPIIKKMPLRFQGPFYYKKIFKTFN